MLKNSCYKNQLHSIQKLPFQPITYNTKLEQIMEKNLKNLFCEVCCLQFDKKYVFNFHLKVKHMNIPKLKEEKK